MTTHSKKEIPCMATVRDIEGRARAAGVLASHIKELQQLAATWHGYSKESAYAFADARDCALKVQTILKKEARRYRR